MKMQKSAEEIVKEALSEPVQHSDADVFIFFLNRINLPFKIKAKSARLEDGAFIEIEDTDKGYAEFHFTREGVFDHFDAFGD